MWVKLGNPSPVEHVNDATDDDPDRRTRQALRLADGKDETVTTVRFPDAQVGEDGKVLVPAMGLNEAFRNVTDASGGLWQAHSDGPPSWVQSDDEDLARMIAREYGCEIKRVRKADHPDGS
jgi:hypothetical protein